MLTPSRLHAALEQDLASRRAQAEPVPEAERLPFLPWVEKHIQVRGRPFSLVGHEYLREIYTEAHPWMVFQKAAQVGISSRCLFEAFWLAEQLHAKILYYLSTDQDSYDFSNDRINIAIADSEHLLKLVEERDRGRDNVGLRHVGGGSLFCRGMFTRRKVKSVDGDMLVLDELDEADQTNKQFALDRILHSTLQYVRELSQPSIPDYGIHEAFQQTDQRYWHLKCPACGQRNCFELELEERDGRLLPRHFMPVPKKRPSWAKPAQQWYRGCLHCHQPLDVSQGEWVALYPSVKDKRGYQISQLYRELPMVGYPDPADWVMTALLRARKVIDKTRTTISILGMPYAGDRAPITDQVLDSAEGDEGLHVDGEGCFLGADQGDDLHLVVARPTTDEHLQVVWVEHTDDWRRIPELIQRFGVRCAVGDALPNKQSMKDLARAARIPFYIQYFTGSTLQEGEEGEKDRSVRTVKVDRTESLDETTQNLKDGQILLPRTDRLDGEPLRVYELFRAQCKMLVKDLVQDAKGVVRFEYKKRTANHFGMALNSCRIAWQVYRGVRVDIDQLQTSGIRTTASRLTEEPAYTPSRRPMAWHEADSEPSPRSEFLSGLKDFGY